MPPAVGLLVFAAVSIAAAGGYAWSVRGSHEKFEKTNANRNEELPTTHEPSTRILGAMLGLPVVFLLIFWAADAKGLPSRAVVAGLFLAALAGAGGFSLQRKLESEASGELEDRESKVERSSMDSG